jgi:hypothetical protein
VRLARLRRPKVTCFLSYVKYRPNTNTSNIIYTHKYVEYIHSKVRPVEETKGGGKEGEKDND